VTTGHTHLSDFFRSRREPGKAGLPVTSVTMYGGLMQRDALDRKSNGNLAPEEHLLIRKGDIAYNMMRMWQGASGLAENDGIVSPAYVVVAPKDGIDPLFASYWFKSARMIHLFWAYSYGITGDRLRLYYKDFARGAAQGAVGGHLFELSIILWNAHGASGVGKKGIAVVVEKPSTSRYPQMDQATSARCDRVHIVKPHQTCLCARGARIEVIVRILGEHILKHSVKCLRHLAMAQLIRDVIPCAVPHLLCDF